MAIAGQQQARVNMFFERYLTFIEAVYDYYNVTVGSELSDLLLTDRSASQPIIILRTMPTLD